jgi:transposase
LATERYKEGERPATAARRFRVRGPGQRLFYSWLRQRREEGRCAPKRMGGGPEPAIRGEAEAALKRLVGGDNRLTLAGYSDKLAEEAGVHPHPDLRGEPVPILG